MERLRIRVLLFSLVVLQLSAAVHAADGSVVRVNTALSATEAVEKLKGSIAQMRYKIFSELEHGDTDTVKRVIAFGKSSHTARIMWHDPAAALEMPLKIAVLQDDVGVQVIYRKPTALRSSYSVDNCGLLDELDSVMEMLAQQVAE